MIPTVFSFDRTTNKFQTGINIPSADGEMRDAKWIKYAGGKEILVLAENNKGLLFYKPVE